jgi:chemosensory pili system protein ChpA (sensor histidine kinase/response regulator)
VDSLSGNQEVVVKAVGPQLARIPGLAGATVLANGEIALILNPSRWRRARSASVRHAGGRSVIAPATAVQAAPVPAAPTAPRYALPARRPLPPLP